MWLRRQHRNPKRRPQPHVPLSRWLTQTRPYPRRRLMTRRLPSSWDRPQGENISRRTVRGSLASTASVLGGIERAALSPARRVQYDTARRFLDQATEAIAVDNVTFAHYLGQKADTLARSLETP